MVVRYVYKSGDQYVVREDPVNLMDALPSIRREMDDSSDSDEVSMSGKNIGAVLKREIHNICLDTENMVAQCYDGAAAMCSERVGVAAQIKSIAPLADYYHCAMHGLIRSETRTEHWKLSSASLLMVPNERKCCPTC